MYFSGLSGLLSPDAAGITKRGVRLATRVVVCSGWHASKAGASRCGPFTASPTIGPAAGAAQVLRNLPFCIDSLDDRGRRTRSCRPALLQSTNSGRAKCLLHVYCCPVPPDSDYTGRRGWTRHEGQGERWTGFQTQSAIASLFSHTPNCCQHEHQLMTIESASEPRNRNTALLSHGPACARDWTE